jgi:hypothetical protein
MQTSIGYSACPLYHQIQSKCEEILALGNQPIFQIRLSKEIAHSNNRQEQVQEGEGANTMILRQERRG